MRTSAPLRVMALCTLTALAVAGCTTKPNSGPTPTVELSWSAEQETQAVQGAEQAVRDWLHVGFQCLDNASTSDSSCFDQVSTDNELAADREGLKISQDNVLSYTGEPTFVRTIRVIHVDLSIGPNKEVQRSACIDRTHYDIIKPDGTSVWTPDSSPVPIVYIVRKHSSVWQVADIKDDPEGTSC